MTLSYILYCTIILYIILHIIYAYTTATMCATLSYYIYNNLLCSQRIYIIWREKRVNSTDFPRIRVHTQRDAVRIRYIHYNIYCVYITRVVAVKPFAKSVNTTTAHCALYQYVCVCVCCMCSGNDGGGLILKDYVAVR